MNHKNLIDIGLEAAETPLRRQVKLWARHSNEKADVASELMTAVRHLIRQNPPERAFRSLSIGSSDEPQFRLLQAISGGGIWLFDADREALEFVRERVRRQMLSGVHLANGDLTIDFSSPESAQDVRATKLGDAPFDLILLHHVLYYCDSAIWPDIIEILFQEILRGPGAIHVALMSASSCEPYTTTWLYNHFAKKFYGHHNNQDLLVLGEVLSSRQAFAKAVISQRTVPSSFWCDDFSIFMAVVWMIMLYPDGHQYSIEQRREIVEFVVSEFWLPKHRLKQNQDYLTIISQ
ncbi:MAG: class I SAM-dependent methyltransferase [Pseudomonadota bacterium]